MQKKAVDMTDNSYFQQILVPVDGSQLSLQVQEVAVDIAKKFNSKVIVVHVIPHSIKHQPRDLDWKGQPIPETMMKEMEGMVAQSGEQALSEAKMLFKAENVPVESVLEQFADPAETILDVAEEKKSDLIVLGNRGASEIADFSLGGVAEKVSRHAGCPVLIVKKKNDLSRILVAIDGSKHAQKAFEHAVHLGEKFKSKVTILNVAQTRLPLMKADTAKSIGELIVSDAEKQAKGATVEKKVEVGHPAKSIVEAAKKGNYDLVVVGSRGTNPAKRFFLGSVSDSVARNSQCSVLIVR